MLFSEARGAIFNLAWLTGPLHVSAPSKTPSSRQPPGARTPACRVATLGDTVFITILARRAGIGTLMFCLMSTACVTQPEIYAPPTQRKPLDQEILVRTQPMMDMSDNSIDRFIVKDIARGQQSSPWRWTGKRPTVKIPLKSTLNLKYFMEFALPEATFKDTGPVTITFLVNDQEIDKVKYATPGSKTFEKLVPLGLLKPMSENVLAAEVDKLWVSKSDGQQLGFILVKIGLQQ